MREYSAQSAPVPPAAATEAAGRDAGVFATTRWSVVLHAGSTTSEESQAALDRLCRQYWQPLYYFVRRRGFRESDAQDLVQGFFAKLLEKGLIRAADRERGRFRSFLLTALQNYLNSEWVRANRQKRGGGQEFFSLEESASAEAGYLTLASEARTPDQLFDRRWAQALLETVFHRLREECDGRSGPRRFDVLKEFLFGERGETSYVDAAARLGLSEPATKSAIHRLRRRYGELFTEEIAQTVERPEDVDEEIRHLLTVLQEG